MYAARRLMCALAVFALLALGVAGCTNCPLCRMFMGKSSENNAPAAAPAPAVTPPDAGIPQGGDAPASAK